MPDITMCNKTQCSKAKECYRLRSVPDQYQSYSNFIGLCTIEDDFCMFMKIRPDDKIVDWIEPIAIEISTNTEEETKQEGDDNLIAK